VQRRSDMHTDYKKKKNLKFECGNMLPKPAARYQIA
jgi:hypothetical protein